MFVLETQVQIILVTQINTKKLPEKKKLFIGWEWNEKRLNLWGGLGQKQFSKTENKGTTTIIIIKEYTKLVMHSTVVHHQLTNVQPVLEHWLPPKTIPHTAYELSALF